MVRLASIARVVGLLVLAGAPTQTHAQTLLLHPERFARVGVMDAGFQSYNVEMAQVIGGMFWRPYPPAHADGSLPTASGPMFEAKPAMDLANPRLRKLATALGPAYVRVSVSWANTIYFSDTAPLPGQAPPGFRGVLTRAAWAGVIDFARAVDGDTVVAPILAAHRTIRMRYYDAEAFTGRCTDIAIFETEDVGDYCALVDELRDSSFFSERYFEVVDIIPAVEKAQARAA